MAAASACDPAALAAIRRFGRAALAWEVLRRRSDYRAAYAGLKCAPVPGIAAEPAFTARWGLHFR